jgi:hypothetical protein
LFFWIFINHIYIHIHINIYNIHNILWNHNGLYKYPTKTIFVKFLLARIWHKSPGFSIRCDTRYFYPLRMVIGTS